jgi:Fe-S oxidoreductase
MSLYAHASAGCLHVRPILNLKTAEGMRQYRQIAEQAVEAVIAFHGTTSGEHGEGLLRSEFSERLFGPDLVQAFRQVKTLFDPQKLMNPGKIVDSPPMDDPDSLRYGPQYATPLTLTTTRYDWSDYESYAQAVEMCNGAAVCRKEDGGTMCPSFMATREERDSTRGRANMLRLAMMGRLGDSLADEQVRDVLDLCLSCKACKAECPSAVDMARIKAEFIAHYQAVHGVPMRSRVFANIHRFNQWGSRWPGIVNRLTPLGKRWLGIAPQRNLPRLASQRLSRWYQCQPIPTHEPAENVPILLLDTFVEYYEPLIGQALYYLHQQMGLPLTIQALPGLACCGRPAISKGLLDQAQTMQAQIVAGLGELLEHAPHTRFMLIEPSCASALRDDMPQLASSATRPMAQHIAERTITVDEWLDECRAAGYFARLLWDKTPRTILYHGHCHQKSLWGTQATTRILQAIPNADVQVLDAGCCGMAGSFGYEAEHYEVSMAIAELRLYPALKANPEALVAATGTSCREQIAHIQRRAQHPVEIIAQACGWNQKP